MATYTLHASPHLESQCILHLYLNARSRNLSYSRPHLTFSLRLPHRRRPQIPLNRAPCPTTYPRVVISQSHASHASPPRLHLQHLRSLPHLHSRSPIHHLSLEFHPTRASTRVASRSRSGTKSPEIQSLPCTLSPSTPPHTPRRNEIVPLHHSEAPQGRNFAISRNQSHIIQHKSPSSAHPHLLQNQPKTPAPQPFSTLTSQTVRSALV
mmetsp:Transcript_590/g.2339  ORF Transcript_590/g.2339 Transcript_590/m.2339 type:complete len:209 (-) Transcript_590:57-683(-)